MIAQNSVAQFVNHVHSGAYQSLTQVRNTQTGTRHSLIETEKIDFGALDKHTLKPLGIYGSAPAIVEFLEYLGCINRQT